MMSFDPATVLEGGWLNLTTDQLLATVADYYSVDEVDYIRQIYDVAYQETERSSIRQTTEAIIKQARATDENLFFSIEALLQEYSLNDEDGVTLMCLAEALLRVPDSATVDALIRDKLGEHEWHRHLNKDNSLFVNASTWGLMCAGKLVEVDDKSLSRFFKNSTKPVIRTAVDKAMRIMGRHFVLGRSIKEAIKNAKPYTRQGYSYSYDMLGEAAVTAEDAERYFQSYADAIEQIAKNTSDSQNHPSLSIKLSALHPRFEETQRERVLSELVATVERLIALGLQHNVGITIDAEEADRLELTLALFATVYSKASVRGWGKLGLVVQAYSHRAMPVLCWLIKLAQSYGDQIPVRLVKGAYWDTEIKHCQEAGLPGYPVFTRKEFTDTAYLACARLLLSDLAKGLIYPQFASHNAQTVASITVMAPSTNDFEFQRLHGMGDVLYNNLLEQDASNSVRIYAPVGNHQDLLPYLVRRLLENGANSSFVHQLSDDAVPAELLSHRPLELADLEQECSEPAIVAPRDIYGERANSLGVNLASRHSRQQLLDKVAEFNSQSWRSNPVVNGQDQTVGDPLPVHSPYDKGQLVGEQYEADEALAIRAIDSAYEAWPAWNRTPVEQRGAILLAMAEQIESRQHEIIALCQREAGKTWQDAIDEIREAVDFCRYYAAQAVEHMEEPMLMPGPTGESNELYLEGRGVFVCISPWNFPFAIYTGQIAAALAAGNCVIAKPAETTSLVARLAIELWFAAGLPKTVLQFLPGSGARLGKVLTGDPRVAGVAFTGSNATAHAINQSLAQRGSAAPIAALIAETGGLNAMLVDSTALPEQVARDAVLSAFGSAGQRCSALRVLYVQRDIADRVIALIKGMMAELTLGNPKRLQTDIGPVIDQRAQTQLTEYVATMKASAVDCYQIPLPPECQSGTFVAPTLLEIDSIKSMPGEQFGPIMHLVRYAAKDLPKVMQDINDMGYGLTLGIHSRNTMTYEYIAQTMRVGNVYINRNQIGAVVGVNPFGGCGLSGTGPKAGGPHYLQRFTTEKTITNNTAAIGGNIDLLNKV